MAVLLVLTLGILINFNRIVAGTDANDVCNFYGEVDSLSPSGSNQQVGQDTGVDASDSLVDADVSDLNRYKSCFYRVGFQHLVHPALIAAIASRGSSGGGTLNGNGYSGSGGYGLMQCKSAYGLNCEKHGPTSCAHVKMMVKDVLVEYIKAIQDKHGDWSKVQQLQGGVAAYDAGVNSIQSWANVDVGTTNSDYSNDVIARAQRLISHHGYICDFGNDDNQPCSSGSSYLLSFAQCYTAQSIYLSSLNLNTIYRNYDPNILAAFTPAGWTDTDPTGSRACGAGIEEIRVCVLGLYSECSASLQISVDLEIDRYRARLCEERNDVWVWSSLSVTYFERIAVGFTAFSSASSGISCITNILIFGAFSESSCYAIHISTLSTYVAVNSFGDYIAVYERFYSAYYACIYRQLVFAGCINDFVVGYFAYTAVFQVAGLSFSITELDVIVTKQVITSVIRTTMAIFGDPHLDNGEESDFKTCSAEGERTYLENNYVTIKGTNTAVPGSSGDNPATFLTAVTLNFTDATGAEVAVYSAGNTVPTTFTNLQADVNGGAKGTNENGASVESMNGTVRVHYKRGGIVIGIKKVGGGLNMKIRMADNLYKAATGDLKQSCVGSEVDISVARRRKRDVPSAACAGLSGNNADACEYDLMVTGDDTAVNETYSSLTELDEQVEALDVDIIVLEDDPTTVPGSTSTTEGDPTTVPGSASKTEGDPTAVPGSASRMETPVSALCLLMAAYFTLM